MMISARNIRNIAMLGMVALYSQLGGAPLYAMSDVPICEEVCSSSTACEELCYVDMMEFENGNDITCLDFGVYDTSQACCGDLLCDVDDEMGNCPVDCHEIGNYCNECNPYTQSGCSTGEVCTHDACCIEENVYVITPPPPPPACFVVACDNLNDCCPGDYCLKDDGWSVGTCYPVR